MECLAVPSQNVNDTVFFELVHGYSTAAQYSVTARMVLLSLRRETREDAYGESQGHCLVLPAQGPCWT